MYQIYHGSFHTVSKPRYQMFYTMFVQKTDDIVSDERNCVIYSNRKTWGLGKVWAYSRQARFCPIDDDSELWSTI